jgi:hypothetical protein
MENRAISGRRVRHLSCLYEGYDRSVVLQRLLVCLAYSQILD